MAKKKSSHNQSSQKKQSGVPRGKASGGKARDGSRPPWKKKRRGRVGPDGLVEDVVPTKAPPEFTDKSRGERLQKVMAEAGVASRRDCETLIRRGRVFVNGKRVAALPAWVDPANDEITVEGERIYPSAARDTGRGKGTSKAKALGSHTYIMLNKPKRVISTADDEQDRTTVLDIVAVDGKLPARAKRLYPVGRLDADSTGLILLTNDGELTKRLTHPSYEIEKTYTVTVRGIITEDDIEQLKKGLYLTKRGGGGKKAAMAEIKLLGVKRDRKLGDQSLISVVLKEGQNREIRRLLAKTGHKVRRLHRDAIGPLKLKGLALGEWRLLSASEVARLKRAVGIN